MPTVCSYIHVCYDDTYICVYIGFNTAVTYCYNSFTRAIINTMINHSVQLYCNNGRR